MHFFPTVIATANSRYSGQLRVVEGWGFRHLSTTSLQQSGGIVTQIWSTALKPYATKQASWLILGVAGGSVITHISRKYSPSAITGVDIDPVIVDLGKTYFGLGSLPHLKLIIADAHKYVFTCSSRFDFLLVDLFGTLEPPAFVYTPRFLKYLPKIANRIFINHLYDTPKHVQAAQDLLSTLKKLKIKTSSQKINLNLVISYPS